MSKRSELVRNVVLEAEDDASRDKARRIKAYHAMQTRPVSTRDFNSEKYEHEMARHQDEAAKHHGEGFANDMHEYSQSQQEIDHARNLIKQHTLRQSNIAQKHGIKPEHLAQAFAPTQPMKAGKSVASASYGGPDRYRVKYPGQKVGPRP